MKIDPNICVHCNFTRQLLGFPCNEHMAPNERRQLDEKVAASWYDRNRPMLAMLPRESSGYFINGRGADTSTGGYVAKLVDGEPELKPPLWSGCPFCSQPIGKPHTEGCRYEMFGAGHA